MKNPFSVELKTEESWGHFEAPRFENSYLAVQFAEACLAEEGWAAARVWKYGPAIPGDRIVWDSRS